MTKTSSNVWVRVGVDPEARLRWLLGFGNLDPVSLTVMQRAAVLQEARAFVVQQELDPALRERVRSLPQPTDKTPNVLTGRQAWSAQLWLKEGLDLLSRGEKWNFMPQVTYELDAHGGLFWTRMRSNSRLEQFKALAYDAFRDARFKFRLCPECKRPFVPVRRQAAHPEKNREIRRLQYRRTVTAKSSR